jgi:hypothetical protein
MEVPLKAIVEVALPQVLVPTDCIAFRKEVAEDTAVEVVTAVAEVAVGVLVPIMGPMMGVFMEDMTKSTTWKPTMSMILRLLLPNVPFTRMLHIQATIKAMGNMKVR